MDTYYILIQNNTNIKSLRLKTRSILQFKLGLSAVFREGSFVKGKL